MWKRPLFALCLGLVGYWQFTRLRCAHDDYARLLTHTLGAATDILLGCYPGINLSCECNGRQPLLNAETCHSS